MKTISLFNNKGGVGKTTTLVNMAGYLAKKYDKRVMVLDLDPQSNSTQAILPESEWEHFYGKKADRKTIYDCFEKIQMGLGEFLEIELPVKENENKYGVALFPGHPKMSFIDDEMAKSWALVLSGTPAGFITQNWLNKFKKQFQDQFDYLLIDMGPALGALNRSVLLNSDYFITPMASDIFSLIGISNIGNWIRSWKKSYERGIENFKESSDTYNKIVKDYFINCDINNTTVFAGYSIQQYSKRKFASGERPTKAYESVISQFHDEVINSLGDIARTEIKDCDLKIGDIPYVYSVIPLSQLSKTPIFDLKYSDGIRGNQTSSVNEYSEYMDRLVKGFLKNIGEKNEHMVK